MLTHLVGPNDSKADLTDRPTIGAECLRRQSSVVGPAFVPAYNHVVTSGAFRTERPGEKPGVGLLGVLVDVIADRSHRGPA